jgi:DNA-binding transcriptional MerR regulator
LFRPAHIDHANGRRYYSAEQLSALNRILALKDLGFSLEQIQDLAREQVSLADMQAMLLRRKAEIEAQLQTEIDRIHRIESRLHAIQDADKPLNVVIKHMPTQSVLSAYVIAETFETGLHMMKTIKARFAKNKRYGLCYCICQEQNTTIYDMDLEIGCFIEGESHPDTAIGDSLYLRYRQLPSVEVMATSVVTGSLERILAGYGKIGAWAEANGYRPIELPREVTLQFPKTADSSDMITEVQFPVEPTKMSKR